MTYVTIDQAYLDTLRTHRRWRLRLEVLDGKTGNVLAVLDEAIEGTVEQQRDQIRRTCSLTIAGTDALTLTTDTIRDDETYGADDDTWGDMGGFYGTYRREILDGLFVPHINELRLSRSLVVNRTEVWVPDGIYVITGYSTTEDASGVRIRLTGADRSQRIMDARWEKPYVVEQGITYTEAIRRILVDRYPRVQLNLTENTTKCGRYVFGLSAEGNPWEDLQRMATAIGHSIYFAGDGYCILTPIDSSYATDPVDVLDDGELDIKVKVDRDLDSDQVYNVVVVRGENTTGEEDAPQIQAVAEDLDPESPTYAGPEGAFGRKPYFYSSGLITSQAQAQDTANKLLPEVVGFEEAISLELPIHPGLDVDDHIVVQSARTGVDASYRIDSLSRPFNTGGTMRVTATRRIQ